NEELPTGQQGELVCRGHCVMEGGYFKQPDKTKETIDEGGWLHTGDLATQDEYGYYRITGRIKDMVIVGGFNVFPKIIEDHIIQHPKIQEVSVTGIKDYDLGEIVVAAVIPKNGHTIEPVEVVDWCYGKMSSAAVPRYVIITDKLPISGRGKVQKFKLQEQFNELIKEGKVKKTAPTAAKAKK
ncbi:MAG: AMP-binding protein, partial [Thermoplasmata archaeon HGW-Thermoplasmata-2]